MKIIYVKIAAFWILLLLFGILLYFWWYYREDCVPYTSPLWQVLELSIGSGNGNINIQDRSFKAYLNISPYKPIGHIIFYVNKETSLRIKIYDSIGRVVRTLTNGIQSPGEYNITFDGSNLAKGIYFCQITSKNEIYSQKFVVMR